MDDITKFQSTPPAKAVTLTCPSLNKLLLISIHTASEGGDVLACVANTSIALISIHTASEGGDQQHIFLRARYVISIHTASEGGDADTLTEINWGNLFQSTPPAKAVTKQEQSSLKAQIISIHTASEGGDGGSNINVLNAPYFNPHRQRRR